MEYIDIILQSYLKNIPELIAWTVGVVLAVKMVRASGGKAEKLLLAGCIITLFTSIIHPLTNGLIRWLSRESKMSLSVVGLTMLPLSIINMAAFILIGWSFWLKFWIKKKPEVN